MKNLVTRSISGVVYIALIIGALYLGGWWWFALTGIFTVVATLEYQNIQAKRNGGEMCLFTRALDLAGALMVWAIAPIFEEFSLSVFFAILLMMMIYVLARVSLSLKQTDGDAVASVTSSIFGVLYVAAPLSLINFAMSADEHAAGAILWMFALIWINDTGAYCVGSTLGKHRLCERLSPKKSWEGFWGGMLFCIIASVIYAVITNSNVAYSALFGALVSVFATWGDLFESMLKRSAGVKDAGNIIPGHGGVLDRIDSLLFVAPMATIFAALLLI
jgi:phosphatidate cytidylyltransferase